VGKWGDKREGGIAQGQPGADPLKTTTTTSIDRMSFDNELT